jgi:two-component system alkaline phosphatase synthesis response regulator PhoP
MWATITKLGRAGPMPKKILAVDDERHIMRLIQVNLERAGYEVVAAFGGKEALEKVELENPDLVVLDAMMPYMDGFEVMQSLRNNLATRELPIIMLTARDATTDVVPIERSDDDLYLYYMTKPFDPLRLIRLTIKLIGVALPHKGYIVG